MTKLNSASGRMSEEPKELHHVRIYALDSGAHQVEHFKSERDPHPETHAFMDRDKMIKHLDKHAALPPPGDEEEARGEFPHFETPNTDKR